MGLEGPVLVIYDLYVAALRKHTDLDKIVSPPCLVLPSANCGKSRVQSRGPAAVVRSLDPHLRPALPLTGWEAGGSDPQIPSIHPHLNDGHRVSGRMKWDKAFGPWPRSWHIVGTHLMMAITGTLYWIPHKLYNTCDNRLWDRHKINTS